MLFLYLVIVLLAHFANAQVSIDGCYSSKCRLPNDRYSIYNTLATNCSSTNRTDNYWWFYKRNMGIQLNVNPKWLPYMNSARDLLVLLPGLGESYQYASTGQIKDAYFDDNGSVREIIEVDYNVGYGSSSLYAAPDGLCNYFGVSERLANLISKLNTSFGFQIENMHFIGVSFGAHLAAVTAYLLKMEYGYTVKRITGLDPLGAGYDCVTCESLRLNKGAAKLVDAIHTNPGRLGRLKPVGDIDFYVNWPYYSSYYSNFTYNFTTDYGQLVEQKKWDAGSYFRIPSWIQPGCENSTDPDRCSVLRSAALYAESVRFNKLRGSSCPIPSQLPVCILTDYAYMGSYAPNSSMYKIYYVRTNASPPYGRDAPGSRNNSQSSLGIGLPKFVTSLPGLGTGLPGLGTGLRGNGTVISPLNQFSQSGFEGNTISSSGNRLRILGRRTGIRRTTVSPAPQSTAGQGRRRLFF